MLLVLNSLNSVFSHLNPCFPVIQGLLGVKDFCFCMYSECIILFLRKMLVDLASF